MRIGKIFDVDIVIHISWIFVFALVSWALGSDVGPLQHLEVTSGTRAILGVLGAVLFFASVLIHELAHSILAKRRSIPVSRITLFIFGGVSSLEAEPANAGAEGWVALIGPVTSLVLGLFFAAASSVLGYHNPFGAVAQYLAFANVALAVFNLLPALPLDGGRVLHALIWVRTRNRMRATQIAARVGRFIAGAIIGLGILDSLFVGFGHGLWLIFIGWFILQAGGAELAQAKATVALQGLTASDLATPISLAIPADSASSTAFESLLRFSQSSAPVVLDRRLLGLVSLYDIASVEADARSNTPVTAVMKRADAVRTVRPDADANDVLRVLGESGYRQIPVVDSTGDLLAVVSREGVLQRIAVGSHHPVRK